jgi:glycosyltransferase involved in cell wall biosynthesis
MKIIHINTSDKGAGAPNAVLRLHRSLISQKIDSEVWVNNKYSNEPKVFSPFGNLFNVKKKIKLYFKLIFVKALRTTNGILHSPQLFSSKQWVDLINKSQADIIHLHWFQQEMLSVTDLKKIKKPLVWTFHDMWPFCGAEHVSYDSRYIEGYNKFNRPDFEQGFDINKWVWTKKRKNLTEPIQVIAPSKWMKQSVRKSFLMKKWPIVCIHNAIDLNIWSPINKKSSRNFFNLPNDLDLILFGSASGTKDYHKGYDLLTNAIKKLEQIKLNRKLGLVIFGESKPLNPPKFNLPVYYLGYLSSQTSLRNAYSAVDLTVLPSRIDNLPNIGIEANACGTPVIAFNTCGIPSIIKNKFNGYLAKPFDIDDLVKGILWVLNNNNMQLRSNCRKHVVDNFDSKKIALEHIELYKKVLNK